MNIVGILLPFVLPMIATIPVAAFLCRRRLSRNKRVSYGTVLLAACCVPLLLGFWATCMSPDMWWSSEHKNDPEFWRGLLLYMVGMCVLPAFFVVLYYQRRPRADQLPAVQQGAPPNSRLPSQAQVSPEIQSLDSERASSSSGCG